MREEKSQIKLVFTFNQNYFPREKILSLVVTRCITSCYSLYHLLSLIVPVLVSRYTTRCHSFYHSLSIVAPLVSSCCTIRSHSLSLDVPLVCLLIKITFLSPCWASLLVDVHMEIFQLTLVGSVIIQCLKHEETGSNY